jgi:PAS domain S-box-containing protein
LHEKISIFAIIPHIGEIVAILPTGGTMSMGSDRKLSPLNIALLYIYLGGLWVIISGQVLLRMLQEPAHFRMVEAINHGIFIFFTAGILYFLIRRNEQDIIRPQKLLSRVNRALKVFTECNRALIRANDELELMKGICQIFVHVGGYRLAWVGIAEQNEEKTVRPVAQWGDTGGYLDTLKISWSDDDWGRGPTGLAIRTATTRVVQHIPTDPQWALWREEAAQHGFAASISLPLLDDDRAAFGALVIFAGEPDAFHEEEVELLKDLARDLSFGIGNMRMKKESERGKKERRLLATTLEQAMDGVLAFDSEGSIQHVNPAFTQITGYLRDEVVEKGIEIFLDCDQNRLFFSALAETPSRGEGRTDRFINQRPDGSRYEIESRISPVFGPTGSIISYAALLRDVTHEMQLEMQLRQAQKMEAIATLAGGIAHDFNNILAAIITNAEMARDDSTEGTPLRDYLDIILRAGFRARTLVKQILTLSCQGEQERQPVQIDLLVKECLKLLRASLPSTIEIPRPTVADLGTAMVDPTQIHQVIMNLCTNAADAMRDGGGRLTLSLSRVDLESAAILPSMLPPGPYLRLAVEDTGHGMDRETMGRIFDPFFTTKGQGRGTGLGLSVVHAILKRHGGAITVDSTPGQGSVFHVFLPRMAEAAVTSDEDRMPDAYPLGKNERILLVDDEEAIVFGVQKMLEFLGYQVVAGTDSREALEVFRTQPERFDLVITDQTMPHLTGARLAREILKIRPDIPIILCSGTDTTTNGILTASAARSAGIRELVMKPTQRKEMAIVIRRVLDQNRSTLVCGQPEGH